MYKHHKVLLGILGVVLFAATYLLKLDFTDIAGESISIISIMLAIYTLCISNLAGNFQLLSQLKSTRDKNIKDKTQLGVIKTYIKSGMYLAMSTLILATISKLKVDWEVVSPWVVTFINKIPSQINSFQLFSSLCFALFYLNFLFFVLIFIFILAKQLDVTS